MEKVDTIEKWVVGPGDVVLSECENKTHAKEVAGIINSMIQAAYDKGYSDGYNTAIDDTREAMVKGLI